MVDFNADEVNALNEQVVTAFRENDGILTEGPFKDSQIVLLHHVGAKSGIERINPLAYTLDGDDVVIIASKGGTPENPAWYHNLVANPKTTIELGPDTINVTAQPLTEGAERDRLFKQMADQYENFWDYQKSTDRTIPVVVLHRD